MTAFSTAGDRFKVKRRTKESTERVEKKSKDLGIATPPLHTVPHSHASMFSVPVKQSSRSMNSARSQMSKSSSASELASGSLNRLVDGLGLIDGTVGSVELPDSWSQSADSVTLDSSLSTTSTSTLDNWYSQLPPHKKDKMSKRAGLWGIADQDRHELKRVGQRELWVKKKKKQSRLLRFVRKNLLTAGSMPPVVKAPPREIRVAPAPTSPLTDDGGSSIGSLY
jgi:hypothetical protein